MSSVSSALMNLGTVALGGGLTLLGLLVNNAHQNKLKTTESKRRIRAELQAKEYMTIELVEQLRYAEINLMYFLRKNEELQRRRISFSPEDYADAMDHSERQIDYHRRQTADLTAKMLAATSDLHKNLAEIMQVFGGAAVYDQCAKITRLPAPPLEQPPATLRNEEELAQWTITAKSKIRPYLEQVTIPCLGQLKALLDRPASTTTNKVDLRLTTLAKGLWETLKD